MPSRRANSAGEYGGHARPAARWQRRRPRAAPRPAAPGSPGAPGRATPASVTATPTTQRRRRSCAVRTPMPASGRSTPTALNSSLKPFATTMPATRPTSEAITAITSASPSTVAQHLPADGADRAQHRELAHALGDGDRERVEDDERAHEYGRDREREQQRGEEGLIESEMSFDCWSADCAARLHLHEPGHRLDDSVLQLDRRQPGSPVARSPTSCRPCRTSAARR